MRLILTLLFFSFSLSSNSQNSVVKIERKNYVSYFDKTLRQPIVVKYWLYKGGGNCSRRSFVFRNDLRSIRTATLKDYLRSGYDRGHLANAQDFAYDCRLDELTFRYYNCIPQSKMLNRGTWRQYESKVRELSQKDSVLVICFAEDFRKVKSLYVPRICGKIVIERDNKTSIWLFDQKGTMMPGDSIRLKKYICY